MKLLNIEICNYGFFLLDCHENSMIPCSAQGETDLLCVSELQMCDNMTDCPSGSDEHINCGNGKSPFIPPKFQLFMTQFLL